MDCGKTVGSWPLPGSQKSPIRAELGGGGVGVGGDRGCSHANVAVTIVRGRPRAWGSQGRNKALAFSPRERTAFLGGERGPPHSHWGPHRVPLAPKAGRFVGLAFLLTRALHTKCRYFPKRRL
jgi:hypothetical protein